MAAGLASPSMFSAPPVSPSPLGQRRTTKEMALMYGLVPR